jgi:hypothetical protein
MTVPLAIDFRSISSVVSTGPNDIASVHGNVQVALDGVLVLASDEAACGVGPGVGSCNRPVTNSQHFSLQLTPGLHPLLISVEADRFANSQASSTPAVAPEPGTLLLFGTTMAGLGLTARWRRRRQN